MLHRLLPPSVLMFSVQDVDFIRCLASGGISAEDILSLSVSERDELVAMYNEKTEIIGNLPPSTSCLYACFVRLSRGMARRGVLLDCTGGIVLLLLEP